MKLKLSDFFINSLIPDPMEAQTNIPGINPKKLAKK